MKKGILVLLITTAITIISWFFAPITGELPFVYHLALLIGALALVGFAWDFFISARIPVLDSLFNGLDKAYIIHKWLGIAAVVLAVVHTIMLGSADSASGTGAIDDSARISGMPSLFLFLVLFSIALLARKMNYETWKKVHKFLLAPYLIGIIHYYTSSLYHPLDFNLFGIWMNIVNLIGILSGLYSVFLYELVAFPYKYHVTSVKHLADKTVAITGTANGKKLCFRSGQFTFLKMRNDKLQFLSHPFTISSAPENEELRFSIKNLGDDTARLIDAIKVDDVIAVSAAHGMFDYSTGGRHQIWIAGGIGITPFRSFYLSEIPENYSIDFFYGYNNEAEGVYLDELKNLQKPNLRIHLVDASQQGFLTVDKMKEQIDLKNLVDIYFCGPLLMRGGLQKDLENSGIQVRDFHFEEFQFLK